MQEVGKLHGRQDFSSNQYLFIQATHPCVLINIVERDLARSWMYWYEDKSSTRAVLGLTVQPASEPVRVGSKSGAQVR